MSLLEYPAQSSEVEEQHGVHPIDFILETVIKSGIEWFLTDPKAPKKVFGHLLDPWLDSRYGQNKIDEIYRYIDKYKLKVVQHFSLIDVEVPSISIQLLDGYENTERAGMSDYAANVDALDANNHVLGRTEVGYIPITDNIQIGIHAISTPDLVKYLYYLVVYILSSFKPEMEKRGMHLGTFRATDLSRMNEFLPENLYSRFINFTVFSISTFDKGDVPIIESIVGLSYPSSSAGDPALQSDVVSDPTTGLRAKDIKQGE